MTSFVNILGTVGAITGGLTGILIVLMHYNSKKRGERKPEFSVPSNMAVYAALIIFFALGILHETGLF